MDSGGSKTTGSQTSSTSLVPGTKEGAAGAIGDARNLYGSGKMFQPFGGSTVVPTSAATQQGMDEIWKLSGRSMDDLQGGFNAVSGIASGTGYNAEQNDALAQLRKVSSGSYLDPNTNPGFANVLQQAQDAARDSVNLGAAGMGRTGSGVHQGVLAKNVGDVTGNLLYQNYNTERGYQNQATGDLFNAGQQGMTNRTSAAAMLPQLYQGMLAPAQSRMGIGAIEEDRDARQMNDQLRIWQGTQDAPRQSIEWLSGILGGAGQIGASNTTTIQQPKTSPFMAGLGGAATGFGVGGPVGAAIGGGAGLLGSLF